MRMPFVTGLPVRRMTTCYYTPTIHWNQLNSVTTLPYTSTYFTFCKYISWVSHISHLLTWTVWSLRESVLFLLDGFSTCDFRQINLQNIFRISMPIDLFEAIVCSYVDMVFVIVCKRVAFYLLKGIWAFTWALYRTKKLTIILFCILG